MSEWIQWLLFTILVMLVFYQTEYYDCKYWRKHLFKWTVMIWVFFAVMVITTAFFSILVAR